MCRPPANVLQSGQSRSHWWQLSIGKCALQVALKVSCAPLFLKAANIRKLEGETRYLFL